MTWWMTETDTPVVDLDETAPWYWVILTNAWLEVKAFWFRGNPRQVLDSAQATDVRRVEIVPAKDVNEWRTE